MDGDGDVAAAIAVSDRLTSIRDRGYKARCPLPGLRTKGLSSHPRLSPADGGSKKNVARILSALQSSSPEIQRLSRRISIETQFGPRVDWMVNRHGRGVYSPEV
jgi:hypothetical protein